jgi:isopenicillin N synthase-like dioxygenase
MAAFIPEIDVSVLASDDLASKQATAKKIAKACTTTGFFTITGHGVDVSLIAGTRAAAAEFFSSPETLKNLVLRPPEKISRGWNPLQDRSLANTLGEETPPDLQEAWAMGPPDSGDEPYFTEGAGQKLFAPNKWPKIPQFREILTAYHEAMTSLANRMMKGFALALNLEENYFARQSDRPCSVVRLVRYPAQTERPLTGQLRAGAHTDYGSFTFVKGDNVPGGLQVSDGSGGWVDVEAPLDGFVCNIGDTMQRWTGGKFRSTLHRVINPPAKAVAQNRISLVYFHLPNIDAVLGDARDSDALTFGEHYLGKIVKAAKSDNGGSSASAKELVSGGLVE